MKPLVHRVRRQSLELLVEDEAAAFALQARIKEINRELLIPAIERVLDRFDRPEVHVTLGRLGLDLGRLSVEQLHSEAELEQRVQQSLEEALGRALAGKGDPRSRERSASHAPLQLLAFYLGCGVLPSWASREGWDPQGLVLSLVEDDPAGLVAVLRDRGRQRLVLERLVALLEEQLLERLVALLEPRHFALVLEYIAELRHHHRRAPLVPLGREAFARQLWLVVLGYLVREHGSQFNRRSFMETVLRQLASAAGLGFEALLGALWTTIEALRGKAPLRSLPAVVETLVAEHLRPQGAAPPHLRAGGSGADAAAGTDLRADDERDAVRGQPAVDGDEAAVLSGLLAVDDPVAAVRSMLSAGAVARAGARFPWMLLTLVARAPEVFVAAVRGSANRSDLLMRLVDALGHEGMARLVERLERLHAAVVIEYVTRLQRVDRSSAGIDRPTVDLGRRAWRFALAYLLREPGTQFNRRRLLESMLRGLGAELGLSFEVLLEALRQQLEGLARAKPLHSLPAVVQQLAHEHAHRRGSDPRTSSAARMLHEAKTRGPLAVERAWAELVTDRAHDEETLAAALLSALDPTEALRVCLSHWGAVLAAVLGASIDRPEAVLRAAIALRGRASPRGLPPALVDAVAHATGLAAPEAKERLLRAEAAMTRARSATSSSAPERQIWARVQAGYDRLARTRRSLAPEAGTWRALLEEAPSSASSLAADLRWLMAWPPRLRAAFPLRPPGARRQAIRRALAVLDASERSRLLGQLGEDPSVAALDPAARAPLPDPGDALALALLTSLRRGGQRRTLRATEHTQVSALARGHAEVLRELVQRLLALGDPLAMRFFAEPTQALEVVRAVASPRHAAALRLALALDEVDPPLRDLGASAIAELVQRWLARPRAPSFESLLLDVMAARAGPLSAVQREAIGRACREEGEREAWSREAMAALAAAPRHPASDRALALDGPEHAHDALLARVQAELLASTAPALTTPHGWERILDTLAAARPGRVTELLREAAEDRRLRARWVAALPESVLARILALLAPRHGAALLEAAELVMAAWGATAGHTADERGILWGFVLAFVVEQPTHAHDLDRMVAALLSHLCEGDDGPRPHERRQALRDAVMQRARERGHARLMLALRSDHTASPASASVRAPRSEAPQPPRPSSSSRPAFALDAAITLEQSGDAVTIHDAGLVLTGPFLPRWLEVLGVYTPGERGLALGSTAARSRAVHLLQWLVRGRCDEPEPELVLDKVLLGLPTSAVVEPSYSPQPDELSACERLLTTVLGHWGVLGGTSVAGLRETFLQREGRLWSAPEGWRLTVQRKTLDVLVDQVPWTLSVIKHPWMERPLYVGW